MGSPFSWCLSMGCLGVLHHAVTWPVLTPSPPQQHSNASQSLCDIIRLSREQMIQVQDTPEPDQLLATLEKWVWRKGEGLPWGPGPWLP